MSVLLGDITPRLWLRPSSTQEETTCLSPLRSRHFFLNFYLSRGNLCQMWRTAVALVSSLVSMCMHGQSSTKAVSTMKTVVAKGFGSRDLWNPLRSFHWYFEISARDTQCGVQGRPLASEMFSAEGCFV